MWTTKGDEWKSKKRKWGEKRKAEPVTRCRRFCQEDPFEFHKAMLENQFSLKFSTMQWRSASVELFGTPEATVLISACRESNTFPASSTISCYLSESDSWTETSKHHRHPKTAKSILFPIHRGPYYLALVFGTSNELKRFMVWKVLISVSWGLCFGSGAFKGIVRPKIIFSPFTTHHFLDSGTGGIF